MSKGEQHKHADLIKMWADGWEIEEYDEGWGRWVGQSSPSWSRYKDYRRRPEPKPDQVVYPATASYRGENGYAQTVSVRDQLKLTFDGETGRLKHAEVIKDEI